MHKIKSLTNISAGQRLIASKIKKTIVYIRYVYTVYIYVFINTNTCMYLFKKNVLCLYIKYIYI